MTTAPLILLFPDNEIVVVPNKSDTIRIHRVKGSLDTILKRIMMHAENTEPTVECNDTTAEDVLNDPYERAAQGVDCTPKKDKTYIKKKKPCPIPGCNRNNQPLILSTHLLKVHQLPKAERMYWLNNAVIKDPTLPVSIPGYY